MLPCRRFADVLADACARLGADVDRYSFIAVDFHHILLAGLPAHSLELRPAHSRRHLYVTSYTEGFSHFVTSMTAPVASGWSVRRVGLAPTGKRRLLTAHANTGHCPRARRMGHIDRGCVKTPRSFHTLVVLVCFRGLRSIRSRKIAKNFRSRDRLHFFDDFLHSLDPELPFKGDRTNGREAGESGRRPNAVLAPQRIVLSMARQMSQHG